MISRFRTGKYYGSKEEFLQASRRSQTGNGATNSIIISAVLASFLAMAWRAILEYVRRNRDEYRRVWIDFSSCGCKRNDDGADFDAFLRKKLLKIQARDISVMKVDMLDATRLFTSDVNSDLLVLRKEVLELV